MPKLLLFSRCAMTRELLALALRGNGYAVVLGDSGSAAFAEIAVERPDVFLIDAGNDLGSGLNLVRYLRATSSLASLPIVVLASKADRETVMESARLRTSGLLLTRQFTFEALLQMLKKAIASGNEAAAIAPPAVEPKASISGTSRSAAEVIRELPSRLIRKDIEERLRNCEQLRAMPPTAAHVLKLTNNAQVSVDSIAKAIAQDHAIALRILKLANSAVFTRGEPVESVHKAVVRIGVERIREAVLNVTVIEEFSKSGNMNLQEFWEHSIATGLIAAELARLGNDQTPDSAFTMGLLHDVGRVILSEQFGDIYGEVIAVARHTHLPLELIESRMLQMNHAEVAEHVLSSWRFAKQLAAPIVNHHRNLEGMKRAAPSQLNECLRLALANRLSHALLLGSSGNEVVYPMDQLCQALRIDGNAIARISESVKVQTADMKFSMLSMANSSGWPLRKLRLRKSLSTEFRPLFVAMDEDTNAIGIMLRELADEDGPPTIAVCHVGKPADDGKLGRALLAAEGREGVNQLPALILSAGGKALLTGVGDRQQISMATPVDPLQLLEAASCLVKASTADGGRVRRAWQH